MLVTQSKEVLWAFRVASRPEVGGGHVARCLTLAGEVVALGDRVIFVLDDDGLDWQHQIAERGHGCISASSTLSERTHGCLLDGYAFDAQTIQRWRDRASIMVAIVDHQPQPDWADLTIAPAMSPSEAAKSARATLAGLDYALVDPRFVKAETPKISKNVDNVLVSFGLRDSRNATGVALNALEQLPEVREGSISVTVAIGKSAAHLAYVRKQVERMERAECAIGADMMRCYAQADLAIGAGGVGLYERMTQGLPSVSVAIAENQRQGIAICAASGGTIDAGRIEDISSAVLAKTTSFLWNSRDLRADMSAHARAAVDGLGAERCAQAMRELLHDR